MKSKIGISIIFLCSLAALIISLKLLWNMGIYADEYSTSPVTVYGGNLWNMMSWLRLLLLAVITFLSGTKVFSK